MWISAKHDLNMTTDTERRVIRDLRKANSRGAILDALEPLNGEQRTPASEAIVVAAGNLLSEEL